MQVRLGGLYVDLRRQGAAPPAYVGVTSTPEGDVYDVTEDVEEQEDAFGLWLDRKPGDTFKR